MLYTICCVIVLAIVKLDAVSAGIYVTRPFPSTVCRAGHSTTITWVDDGCHLKDTRVVKIDLYKGRNIYFKTLAAGVNSLTRSQKVLIPPSRASTFMTCFTSAKLPLTTSTADLMIKNTTVFPVSMVTDKPLLTLVLPTTSQLSPTTWTSISPAATTGYVGPYGDNDSTRFKPIRRNGAGQSATLCKRIRLETVKFRLVFIFWPALVGITMAL